jgi:uncharacterized protein
MRLLSVLLLVFCGAVPAAAGAAGLECARAASPTEKKLCADPVLRRMDQRLNTAYAKGMKQAADPARAAALKADQGAWLVERDRCADRTACLRQSYADREVILHALDTPFAWNGKWWRVNANGFNPAALTISRANDTDFRFAWEAYRGANNGSVEGRAQLADANSAAFVGAGDTRGCTLTFKRVLDQLQVTQSGDSPTCGAGAGVTYDGRYVKAAQDPNPKPDLITLGVLENTEQDAAIRTLMNADYEYLVDTASSIAQDKSLDGKDVSVTEMWVRGLACGMKSVLMQGPRKQLWVAVWEDDANGGTELRYYTNVAADKNLLPKTIAAENESCNLEDVTVKFMP